MLWERTQSETFTVSCLRCGAVRRTSRSDTGHLHAAECPACGYLGWREADASIACRLVTSDSLAGGPSG